MTTKDDRLAQFDRLKPGDVICLTDTQTLTHLMKEKAKDALKGTQMTISRVRKIKSEFCTWTVCDLSGDEQLFLIVKRVDDLADIGIYFRDESVPVADRAELITQGHNWLFKPPENQFNYRPADLSYTEQISYDDGNTIFTSDLGAISGECRERPKPPGIDPQFAIVVEYQTPQTIDNPLLFVLELGGVDEYGSGVDGGGVITYFQGTTVNSLDVDVLAV